MEEYRSIVSEIASLLEVGREKAFAAQLRKELAGTDLEFEQFLISDELWGGPGSLADSALAYKSGGIDEEKNRMREIRRANFQDLMIQLGSLQIANGIVNAQTIMWVSAFDKWRRMGLSLHPGGRLP